MSSLDFVNLSSGDLRGAKLMRAQGYHGSFVGTDFSHADFSRAQLGFGDFTGANLNYARLWGAHLTHANFTNADLTGADFRGAYIDNAIFEGANLTNCSFAEASVAFANFGRSKNLTQASVDSMYGIQKGYGKAKLPKKIKYPVFWHKSNRVDIKSAEQAEHARLTYRNAVERWKRDQEL